MGYNTHYKLGWTQVPKQTITAFVELNLGDNAEHIHELIAGRTHYGRWFGQQVDMRLISTAFPNTLFTLTAAGEDHPDLWIEYYLGGRLQYEDGVIVYPPFDKDKLGK